MYWQKDPYKYGHMVNAARTVYNYLCTFVCPFGQNPSSTKTQPKCYKS